MPTVPGKYTCSEESICVNLRPDCARYCCGALLVCEPRTRHFHPSVFATRPNTTLLFIAYNVYKMFFGINLPHTRTRIEYHQQYINISNSWFSITNACVHSDAVTLFSMIVYICFYQKSITHSHRVTMKTRCTRFLDKRKRILIYSTP